MHKEMTLKDSIDLAVMTEKLGAAFYKTLAGRFQDNAELNELFSILAKDEATHREQFQSLLTRLPAGEKRAEGLQYLAATSMSTFFKGEEGAFSRANTIRTKDDALSMAFAFEKASLLYFQALDEVMGGNDILNLIIKAEKSHLVSVMKYLMTDAQMRGLADDW